MRRITATVVCSLLWLAAPTASPAQDAPRDRLAALLESPPSGVPRGSVESVGYLLDVSRRIERRFPEQSEVWERRAERFLDSMEEGTDPYPLARGQILNRGYDASFSPTRQGYAIYLPEDYDPSRSYPLLVMLHGGSSNGNLFLGVVLGNNMDWERYSQFLWDDFTPRWGSNMIVVAPDGVGQLIWRWMGEQDVLEVIDDVQRHYNVDADRVILGGLSNGGMGAHSIGSRHAWRFSHVQAMAGAPSWLQYTGGRPTETERIAMRRYSAMDLFRNTTNTDYHYYHGTEDPGPMRPAFIRELTRHVTRDLGLTPNEHWYNHGHDLLYLVHRHGRVYEGLSRIRRDRRPADVTVVTGDYRANRQHWVTVSRIERYPELATVRAHAEDGALEAHTENALEVAFDLRDAPVGRGETLRVSIDDAEVYSGPRAHLGHAFHVARGEDGEWSMGFVPAADGLEKRPGLAGPMSDAYHDEIIHVYGTQDPEHTAQLERAAQRGANGWPMGVWYLNQRVIPDTDVTPALARAHHLALYGSPGDNSVLERIQEQLPIHATADAIVMADGQRFEGSDVGARFIYPNPEAPDRYVLVHTGINPEAVWRTRNLPDFLPDFVVYNRRTTTRRPRLISGRQSQLVAGYFDRFWQLPPQAEQGSSAATPTGSRRLPPNVSAEQMREYALMVGAPPDFILPPLVLTQTPAPELPPAPTPATPPRARRFSAPRDDPNGPIARQIARLVPTFYNYRAVIAGARWHTQNRSVWQIRPQRECLDALDADGVPYRRWTEEVTTPVPTPVEITGPVNGVSFVTVREGESVVISCEMAARLPLLTRIVARQRVHRVVVLSSLRNRPRQSFHTMGMALDLFAFDTNRGRLSVNDHFVETPAHHTCDADPPSDWRAAALLRIACDLAGTRRFASVLTPNYNDGHRNHFHLDIRPNDNRVFVR